MVPYALRESWVAADNSRRRWPGPRLANLRGPGPRGPRGQKPRSTKPRGPGLRGIRVPEAVQRILTQVLYITPLFWFMELAQNWMYLIITGQHGWVYPVDLHVDVKNCTDWYSLRSLPTWALTVTVFSVLDRLFERRRMAVAWRLLIAGLIGWAGEWVAGFVSHGYLHHYLQVWPRSPLVYVGISALPLWFLDFVLFHRLTEELRAAQRDRSGPLAAA